MSDVTQPPKIGRLPEAPNRQSARPDFAVKADAFVAAQDPWGQQVNVLADWMEGIGLLVMQYAQEGEQWNTATEIAKDKAEAAAVSADRSEKSAQKHLDDVEKLIQGFDPTGSGLPVVTKPDAPLVVATKNGGVRFSDRALNNGVNLRPVMRLDFANQGHLDPRVTFSRPSKAWGWRNGELVEYGVNEPVFEFGGLRLEPQGTNLNPNSEDMEYGSGVVFQNTDGVYAMLQAEPITSVPSLNLSTIGLLPNTPFTLSFDIKKNQNIAYPPLYDDNSGLGFVAGAGIVHRIRYLLQESRFVFSGSTVYTGITQSREPLSDGWERVTLTLTAPDLIPEVYWGWREDAPDIGEPYFWVKNIQIEQSSYASSFIPTDGTQATRAADQFQLTGESFDQAYNPAQGAFIFKIGEKSGLPILGSTDPYYGAALRTASGAISAPSAGGVYFSTLMGKFVGISVKAPYENMHFRVIHHDIYPGDTMGLSWQGETISLFVNGALAGSFTHPDVVGALKAVERFHVPDGQHMYLERISLFATRPTDAEMEELTRA